MTFLASIFTLWGLKMLAYVGILSALAFTLAKRTKERDAWEAKWRDAYRASIVATDSLQSLQRDIADWKEKARVAAWKAADAQAGAADIARKYDILVAQIQAGSVPQDPGAAIDWLADFWKKAK